MPDPRVEVAAVARMLSRAGLVHAFGHVSVRTEGGGVAITSTRPLVACSPDDVVVLGPGGRPVAGPAGDLPLETPMHRALYAARDDVHAIARGHPPHAVLWGTDTADLPLLHGLGALCGVRVGVHPDIDLIATDEAAREVAATLGDDHALMLRANGALAVGRSALEAATRLFFLEDRARVALGAPEPSQRIPDDGWKARLRFVDVELLRAIGWFERRFGDEASRTPGVAPAPGGEQQEGSGA